MQWQTVDGQYITVHMDEIKTRRYGAGVIAQIKVCQLINGKRYYSIYSEIGRSNRLARKALKNALRMARNAKTVPGQTGY